MNVRAVAKSYFEAWEARDLDAIMALHSPDTVFHSHTGQQPLTGAASVRIAFAQLLQTTPDISFKAWDLRFGNDFWRRCVACAESHRIGCAFNSRIGNCGWLRPWRRQYVRRLHL